MVADVETAPFRPLPAPRALVFLLGRRVAHNNGRAVKLHVVLRKNEHIGVHFPSGEPEASRARHVRYTQTRETEKKVSNRKKPGRKSKAHEVDVVAPTLRRRRNSYGVYVRLKKTLVGFVCFVCFVCFVFFPSADAPEKVGARPRARRRCRRWPRPGRRRGAGRRAGCRARKRPGRRPRAGLRSRRRSRRRAGLPPQPDRHADYGADKDGKHDEQPRTPYSSGWGGGLYGDVGRRD